MRNNTLAMLATIAAVAALASMIGWINPATCVNQQLEGWTSCQAASDSHIAMTVGLALVAVASYVGYRFQVARKRAKK